MAKLFVSFLGIGSPGKSPGYDKAKYAWPGKSESVIEVHFAQTAILRLLEITQDGNSVDRAVFFCTAESKEKHLAVLHKELRDHLDHIPMFPDPDLVPTDMSAENQWGWFEQLLSIVDREDTLIIDFSHGMRAVPIIFSSAIGFLQRAKGISLGHALYAWYDRDNKDRVHPIVDMRDFYEINDWAESVARLTDDADARKLGMLAKNTQTEALVTLADDKLISAFQEMTDCIRNVDVNNVAKKVSEALDLVKKARESAEGSSKLMLDLVWDKFSTLATDYPASGYYDQPYFQSQLKIIAVLLEHRLFMQAFTAMREFVGSLGMVGASGRYGKNMSNSNGRKYRRRFAEVFVNMMQIPHEEWGFSKQAEPDHKTLLPWFKSLQKIGVEQQLREIVKKMVDTRNGFDHAWTSKPGADAEVEKKGKKYLGILQDIIRQLSDNELLKKEVQE